MTVEVFRQKCIRGSFRSDGEPGPLSLVYGVRGGDGRGAFSVDATGADGVVLRTTIELDREVCDTYRVLVEASDSDGHSATAVVVVMVTDVNDNAPSFPEFPATRIREGTIQLIAAP